MPSRLKTGGPTRRPDASVIKDKRTPTDRPGSPVGLLRGLAYHTDVVQAAFFDLDKTVISKSSSLALSRPMYRAGMVTRSQLLKGAYAQLVYLLVGADDRRMERAKEGILAITKGWDREQVEKLARESIEKVLDPFIYQEALDLIALHRALGRRVYIVSSSPEEVVRPLAERLAADGVIATRAESVEGKYTGRLEFYCFGEKKADAVRKLAEREGIDLSTSYAYSDSATDLPLLEAVGSPVAVNPDRDLRKIAEQRNWQIRDFRNPIPLRRRFAHVPHPSRSITAAAAGGAIAAALGWIYVRPRLARLAGRLRRRTSGFPQATLRD